jgi:hypothetical protein
MPFDPNKYLESKEVEFSPDEYLKKKGNSEAALEVGSKDGGQPLPTQGQGTQLPSGYQRILKIGKIPVNPFEKAALGQPLLNEEILPGEVAPISKPTQKKSVYDQAVDDTEKWYGQWPSPRKKLENFNKEASVLKSKYQESGDQVGFENELSGLAKKLGLTWENGNVSVPQAEIDKYEETYTRKLDELSSKSAEERKNPYIKDVLGNLGSGSAQVLTTPYNLLAISEKVGNAILKPLGVDPSTYWQDFSKYLTENQSEMAENSKRYDEDIISLAKSGRVGDAIGSAVLQTAQTLPMLSTLIMGNAAGATNSALAFMGTSSAAQEYMANNDKKDVGELYKIMDAIGVGLAEVAFEEAGTVKILEGIKKGIEERGANIVRDELTNMLKTNMERNISMIMQGNSDMVREGVSEGMTQLAQNYMKKATVNPGQDLWEGVTDATIIGGLIGKGINLSLNAANSIKTAGIKKTIRETVKQIPENYSMETKEKLIPLIIERDAIKAKVAEAADPIKKLHAPQIKVIDDEITKISAKEDGIELPPEEKPVEGKKKEPTVKKPKSEVKVSLDGVTPLNEVKTSESPKGITLNEKTPISENDKGSLKLTGDNLFTRQINKDGEKFGQITVEESGDTWKVKDVVVDKEREGYGKEVYRQMNEQAQSEGKTIVSEIPSKNQSQKATYMWESLVKSGEAIKNEDGSYKMLPKEPIVEPKIQEEGLTSELSRLPLTNAYGFKPTSDSINAATNLFGDKSSTFTFLEKGFDNVNRNIQSDMVNSVISSAHNDEIFKAIIKTVPIDVMNTFMGKKFSTNELLHNKDMFLDRLSINSKKPIPSFVSSIINSLASSLAEFRTFMGTKDMSIFNVALIPEETNPTIVTDKNNLFHENKDNIKQQIKQQSTEKIKENAKGISKNESEVYSGRNEQTTSRNKSGENLEQTEAAGAKTGNEETGLINQDGFKITKEEFDSKPLFRVSYPDGKIKVVPDTGQTIQEVFDYAKQEVSQKNKDQKIKEAGGQTEIEKSKQDQVKELLDKEKKGKTDLGYSSLSPGSKTLDELAQERTQLKEGKDFMISERVRSILKDLGVPIAEKYISKRYLGIFKHKTESIRVQSIIDAVVATHEAAHFVSRESGIGMKIRTEKGESKIRNSLTKIYLEFYPEAKASHSLEKRVEEGIAVLMEHYFTEPTYITDKYPELVNTFIKPEGRFHDKKFGQLLSKMNELVDDYAQLSAEQKIGSRVIRSDDIVKRDKGFTWAQKLKYEFLNRFEPLSRTAKEAGVSGEFSDPFVHAFQWMNRGTFVHDWIKGNAKMVLKKDGNWETRPGTVRDYLREVKGKEKEFDTYLVARRVLEDYNNLVDAQNRLDIVKEQYESMKNEMDEGTSVNKEMAELQISIDDITKEVDKFNGILKNDGFNTNDAATVVRKYEESFKKAVNIYDDITKSMIDFAQNSGLISSEIANKYKASKGYAPFFRFVNDELLPENIGNAPSTNAQTKAKIFKQRIGSKYDIVSPTYNQMLAIQEVIGKSLENNIWNAVSKLANQNVEIAKRFEPIETQPFMDDKGNISFPQDKDPNLTKVWINGKRNYFKIAPEFAAVAKNLRGEEWNTFRKIIQLPSAVFTRLTTSANPLFALGNITIDQLSAYMQSKTGYIPGATVVDSFVEMVKAAGKITSDEETAFRKYVRTGGRRQTFAAFNELSPEKTISKVEGGSTFDKVVEKMDLGLTMLELPSNLSEYVTRFGEYNRALKQGRTETEAMFMASQVTTPFQLYGNWYGDIGKSWIKSLPYFNAAVQVNYKFFKTAKEQPIKVATMTAALLGTSLTMAMVVLSSGSDEQKRLLANMPARELGRAIFFPNPWDKNKLIRIRVPEHIGSLTGLATLFAISHYAKQKARFSDYVNTTTSFLPNQLNPSQPSQMIFSWVPKVLAPSIETASNVKTYPELSPIVPDYLLENAPPELQYTEYTTKTAIAIGKLLNISPAKIEFWTREQFGVVGGAVIGRLPNNPLSRQEQHHVTTGRAYSYFYDDKVHSAQEYNTIDRKEFYSDEEKKQVVSDYVLYNKVGNVLSNMRRTIQINKSIPESIKEQAFELLINIDNGERGSKVNEEIESLNTSILDFVKESKLNIGTQYNVTKEAIDQSTEDYISKNIKTKSNNVSRIIPQ